MSDSSAFGRLFGVSRELGDARKAALLLRTVCDADRQWLLGQLSHSERFVLTGLLSELDELGLPADRGLLHEVIRDEPESRAPMKSAAAMPPSTEASLETANAIALARALAGEPAGLIARVLALRDWPWAMALLSELNRDTRRDVESCLVQFKRAKDEGTHQSSNPNEMTGLDQRLLARLGARLGVMASESVGADLIDVRPSTGASHSVAANAKSEPWWQRLNSRGRMTFGRRAYR